ncbi:MAG: hypothetical protein AAF414_18980 [Pseudomonadota bacterium]
MMDGRSRIEGGCHLSADRDDWRTDIATMARQTRARTGLAVNDLDVVNGMPSGSGALVANGIAAAVTPESIDAISCTISDGNGKTATVPVAVTVNAAVDQQVDIRTDLATDESSLVKLTHPVGWRLDKNWSHGMKIQFKGLPSGSVISHPEEIAKKNAELTSLSEKIASLEGEIAVIERKQVDMHRQRQDLMDVDGPSVDIDTLSAEIADLEGLTRLKVAQKSVAEIDRDIARFECRQLTQTACTGGTASFHGPRSGYVLKLPNGRVDRPKQ